MPKERTRITGNGEVVLPKAVREQLGVRDGDILLFDCGPDGVRIEKANAEEEFPFAAFAEWASAADEEAYRTL